MRAEIFVLYLEFAAQPLDLKIFLAQDNLYGCKYYVNRDVPIL